MLSFDQLIQNLTDTAQSSIVRCDAIASLVSRGSSQGIGSLIEVLTDPDSLIRREGRDGTSANGRDSRGRNRCLKRYRVESNDLTLWTMLEAIGELATPDALPMLESLRTAGSYAHADRSEEKHRSDRGSLSQWRALLHLQKGPNLPLHGDPIDPNEPAPTTDLTDSQTTPEEDIVESEPNVAPARHGRFSKRLRLTSRL